MAEIWLMGSTGTRVHLASQTGWTSVCGVYLEEYRRKPDAKKCLKCLRWLAHNSQLSVPPTENTILGPDS